ncbi:MAG: hypothetical protein ACLQGU_11960 [bacterium]
MPIRTKELDVMKECFFLKENPFASIDIYNVDIPQTYVPEVYGDQLREFYKKFFILPMQNETHKQIIGAVWSSHEKGKEGKGFGKSMLMAEESKRINRDLGAKMLAATDVLEEDIQDNPVVAGYCTFDEAKGVKTFAATVLDAVAFILESPCFTWSVHLELRSRIAERIKAESGCEGEYIRRHLNEKLRSYRGLTLQLTHRTLDEFIQKLCDDDTSDLVSFVRNEIGPRVKATQGFNFIHVFNAFLTLAGVVYVVYFIDQVETFARFARNQERDIKVIRESILQTSPTAVLASFVFQMHVHALEEIENWWRIEHLPSVDAFDLRNESRILNLNGLLHREALVLVEKYLESYRLPVQKKIDRLHPFNEKSINQICDAYKGNPRDILRTLGSILSQAVLHGKSVIDEELIEPFLQTELEDESLQMEGYANPLR